MKKEQIEIKNATVEQKHVEDEKVGPLSQHLYITLTAE